MHVVSNKNGQDRVYEFLFHDDLRITGESLFTRTKTNSKDEIIMFSMEGGPSFGVNSTFMYRGLKFNVDSIQLEEGTYITSKPNMVSVRLGITPKYK